MSIHPADLELFDKVREFGLGLSDPGAERFHTALRDRGDDWIAVASQHLPPADRLETESTDAPPAARALIADKIDASADAKLIDKDIDALGGKLN